MTLRLWLIFFGILVFALIGFDAWRKSKASSNLDEELDDYSSAEDEEAELKRRQLQQELPHGSSRKLGETNRDYNYTKDSEKTFEDDPIPLLNNPLESAAENFAEDISTNKAYIQKVDDFNLITNDQESPPTFHKTEESMGFNEQEESLVYREPRLDLSQEDFTSQEELDFAQQFDLEESHQQIEDEDFSENLFELPVTKGLIELEKDLWKKAEESIFIKILAQEGQVYNLAEFWDFCNEADLRLSERGFVHRFLEGEDRNYIQFSIINVVEPGNFLMLNKENSFTKGFIFVQTLPGGFAPARIIDDMVNIARIFVERFGGSLVDEDQSVLTDQTVKYYKDKIRQFKLKSKLPPERDLDKKR